MMYHLIRICFLVLGLLSKERGQQLGAFLGHLAYVIDSRHRKIAIDNLNRTLGDCPTKNEQIAKKVFKNLGKIIFELAWSLRLSEKDFYKYFRIDGVEHIHSAYEKNKGILVLTAHFGNWELLTVISAMIGYPLSIVYRPLDFKPMERFIAEYRTRFGGKLIRKGSALRKILRSLEQKHMVAILLDQNVGWREGVFVDFLGQQACTNKGLALIALKTDVPVVPVFLLREPNGFRAVFLPQLQPIQTGDKTKDIEENTQQYNNVIESFVRTYPDQWFWVHQRWKTKSYDLWEPVHKK